MVDGLNIGGVKSRSVGNPKVKGEPTIRDFIAVMQNLMQQQYEQLTRAISNVTKRIERINAGGEQIDEENVHKCNREQLPIGGCGIGDMRHIARGRLLDEHDDERKRKLRRFKPWN